MKCYVLSGIAKGIIEDIIRRNIRTIELRSAHNVATALRVNLGDCVFLTYSKIRDLDRGVSGVIAEVSGKEVVQQSMFYSSPHYIEESEMAVVRLRLNPKGVGRIIQIKTGGLLEAIEAEVVEVTHFTAW
ncbi:MAG: DUF473 domain-containing protein [Archaeoglobi archaeon]|jgi:hypothetical protein|nr:MAG: DUF473 domain-containing protein [Archaeoglobi archaeon]TDA30214.1 MAG: DUF473 domain-containing protein [Archaeoglobi archaeon]